MFGKFSLPSSAPSQYGLVYVALAFALPVFPLFSTKAIVPLTIAATLVLIVMATKGGKLDFIRRIDRVVWLALSGYLVIALISSNHGEAWLEGILSLGKLLGLMLIGGILINMQTRLSDHDIHWIACALTSAILFTLFWIGISILYDTVQHASGNHKFTIDETYRERIRLYGYYWFKPASIVTSIATLVVGIYLHRTGHRKTAIVLAISIAGLCCLIGSRTAFYGLVAAIMFGICYHSIGRFRLKIIITILSVIFTMPLVMNAVGFSPDRISSHLNLTSPGSNSIVYRMHIWGFVADKITEKPLLGWGAGASKRLGTDEVGTLSDPKFGKLGEPIPVHPHNAILQVWLEFGFSGAFFIFLLIARSMTMIDKCLTEPWQRIWVTASGALIACFFGFSFSITSSWWLVTVMISVAIAVAFIGQNSKSLTSSATEENTLR